MNQKKGNSGYYLKYSDSGALEQATSTKSRRGECFKRFPGRNQLTQWVFSRVQRGDGDDLTVHVIDCIMETDNNYNAFDDVCTRLMIYES